jgi:hypothetical protein
LRRALARHSQYRLQVAVEVGLHDRSRPKTQRLAEAIERYLRLHPAAADDEKGIAQWWLPEMGLSATAAQVRMALALLLRRAVVVRKRLPGGSAIYARAVFQAALTSLIGVQMANFQAVHSVGNSIITFLRNSYPPQMGDADTPDCAFALLSSGELAGPQDEGTRITLYLYKVTVNEHTRQQRPGLMSPSQQAPLGLDLHYLLTAWAGTAQDEQVPLTWAMRQLYLHPILDASSLSPEAGWSADEVIQIIPAELPTEEMMRIWDALEPAYRLSVSYIARMVRVDPDTFTAAGPVVATRLGFGPGVPAGTR